MKNRKQEVVEIIDEQKVWAFFDDNNIREVLCTFYDGCKINRAYFFPGRQGPGYPSLEDVHEKIENEVRKYYPKDEKHRLVSIFFKGGAIVVVCGQ